MNRTPHIDPETFGRAMGQIVREAIAPYAKRIEQLEAAQVSKGIGGVTKALDVEAYDAMVEMSERIDKLESAVEMVAERAVHYRGFWRSGTQAKRNESYTDGGQLWIAINTTTDRPSENSEDWRIAARKGRDAR